ncbi:MAG: hypothetical protein QXN44_07655, partial [Candidatus Caldarchaeum sp.]
SRVKLPPQAPIVGDRIFDIESGIIAGWWNNIEDQNMPAEIFPFSPKVVGHNGIRVVVGKKSGRDSLVYLSRKLGLNIAEEEIDGLLRLVKETAMMFKRDLSLEEFMEILTNFRMQRQIR